MTQRRRFLRKDTGALLVLGGRQHDLVDLSEGGLCVKTDQPIPSGQPMSFALSLPGGTRVEGEAEVAWAEPVGWRRSHGLKITQIRSSARRLLARHLNPYHFGWMEALDLGLQFSLAVVAVLLVRNILRSDPALAGAAMESLPWVFLAAGFGVTAFVMAKS